MSEQLKVVLEELTNAELAANIVELVERGTSQQIPFIIALPSIDRKNKTSKTYVIRPHEEKVFAALIVDLINAGCNKSSTFLGLIEDGLFGVGGLNG